jgi:hypothetical protein
MRWLESVKNLFADGGCLPRLGRKDPEDLDDSYPPEPAGKRRSSMRARAVSLV